MKPNDSANPAERAFIAADPASKKVLEQLRQLAAASGTVLISGESGTGKDLAASVIHYLGPHPEEPFVKIDCASLPQELMESELFGYERGAFTGATQSKRGRMELAGNGTLVLDEVADLTLGMQAKLLRVIEDRTFHRLGGTRAVKLDARIIALTSSDLQQLVKAGTFREDLYFRLNVLPLQLSPLRQRRKDISSLAQHFAAQMSEAHNRKIGIESAAMSALERYDFPGNVRELRNLLERAAMISRGGKITAKDLPDSLRQDGLASAEMLSLQELERRHIAEVLDHTRGKKGKAAEILGISRKNLLEKRKKYGI